MKTRNALLVRRGSRADLFSPKAEKYALGMATTIGDAKAIHDKAKTFRTYFKTRGDGIAQQNKAADIVLRAERRLGEFLKDLPKDDHVGLRRGPVTKFGNRSPFFNELQTLGISHQDATRWQQLAEMEASAFEARLKSAKWKGIQLTLNFMLTNGTKKTPSPSIQDRRTPKWLFEELNRLFGPFLLDAFASKDNAICPDYFTRAQDGCAQDWADVTYGNPSFEDLARPLERATQQAIAGIRSILLGPVGGSQVWYHELAIQGTIYVPDCRLSYDTPAGEPTDGADRDSIIMAFGREHANPDWQEGQFRVQRLPLKHLMPKLNGRG